MHATTQERTFQGIAASTGKAIAPSFSVNSVEDVSDACIAAAGAFDRYRETDAESRARFLEAIGDEIMALGDALIERAHLESGLPIARLTGERGRFRCCGLIRVNPLAGHVNYREVANRQPR